jgi:hypothetical protein
MLQRVRSWFCTLALASGSPFCSCPQARLCRRTRRLWPEPLEDRTLLTGPLPLPPPAILANDSVAGRLTADGSDSFQLTLADTGRFTASVHAVGFATRLSLFDAQHQLLVQSDGQSPSNPDDLIDQHVQGDPAQGATFYLEVTSSAGGAGSFRLTTRFVQATPPFQPLQVGAAPAAVVTGDFNGDGALDLATADQGSGQVSILLGTGDGTFQSARNYLAATAPAALAVGDFNTDGFLDLAVADRADGKVLILRGNGDGTFQSPTSYAVGTAPVALAAGDFNGDGVLDLAVANQGSQDLTLLFGNGKRRKGDGTFRRLVHYAAGGSPVALVVGDLNGDGNLDLALAGHTASNGPLEIGDPPSQQGYVAVLQNMGGGNFLPAVGSLAGIDPVALVAGDFDRTASQKDLDGDSRLDLAVADAATGNVLELFSQGNGRFQAPVTYRVGTTPVALATADFNVDKLLDLAVVDRYSNNVVLLRGRAGGGFENFGSFAVGPEPVALVAADLNGDGNMDLASANRSSNDLTVLLGLGDATFQSARFVGVQNGPAALADADPRAPLQELIAANPGANDLVRLARQPDGSYLSAASYPAGGGPVALAVGDFDGDGTPDLAVANEFSNTVTILLRHADGTFETPQSCPVGNAPEALVAGHFISAAHLDLAVANEEDNTITVLQGKGDGTFAPKEVIPVMGKGPVALATTTAGGVAYLATANQFSDNVTVLRFPGAGTYQTLGPFMVGPEPVALVAADFNGDGLPDLAVANRGLIAEPQKHYALTILLAQDGGGTFTALPPLTAGTRPAGIVAGQWTGDGALDLAVTDRGTDGVDLFAGNGHGGFVRQQTPLPVGHAPSALLAGDANGDGLTDLVVANQFDNTVSLVRQEPDGAFLPAAICTLTNTPMPLAVAPSGGRPTLFTAAPGARNVAILVGQGNGRFQNQQSVLMAGIPAALTVGNFTADRRPDLAVALAASNQVELFTQQSATFQQQEALTVGAFPAALVAADFNGDGALDLAVANEGDDSVSILLGNGDGTFQSATSYLVGKAPVALAVVRFSSDGAPDLAVANEEDGTVSLLTNNGAGVFQGTRTYPVGKVPVALAVFAGGDGRPVVAVADQGADAVTTLTGGARGSFVATATCPAGKVPVALAAADFTGDGRPDLAVALAGVNAIALLTADTHGRFTQLLLPTGAGTAPSALVAADSNGDGNTDLVAATAGSGDILVPLTILLGQGNGQFTAIASTVDRIRATPLLDDFTGDGIPDLAALDRLGRITLSSGLDHAGHFGPPTFVSPPSEQARDLAVLHTSQGLKLAALGVGGATMTLYASQPDGTFVATKASLFDASGNPLTGVTHVAAGDLDGTGQDDLIVVDPVADRILLYRQQADGAFRFSRADTGAAVGAGPTTVAVVDVNGDQRNDLVVANQCSGDVSVLLQTGAGQFLPERFRAGAGPYDFDPHRGTIQSPDGTTGVASGRFDERDRSADLAVTDSNVDHLALLRGDGMGGYFNPMVASFSISPTNSLPTTIVVGRFDLKNSSHLDLALLDERANLIRIFQGDGKGNIPQGNFAEDAGNLPTGLSIGDVNDDGFPDILIGTEQGEVLPFLGNGSGSILPPGTPVVTREPMSPMPAAPKVQPLAPLPPTRTPVLAVRSSAVVLVVSPVPATFVFPGGGSEETFLPENVTTVPLTATVSAGGGGGESLAASGGVLPEVDTGNVLPEDPRALPSEPSLPDRSGLPSGEEVAGTLLLGGPVGKFLPGTQPGSVRPGTPRSDGEAAREADADDGWPHYFIGLHDGLPPRRPAQPPRKTPIGGEDKGSLDDMVRGRDAGVQLDEEILLAKDADQATVEEAPVAPREQSLIEAAAPADILPLAVVVALSLGCVQAGRRPSFGSA